MIDEKSSGSWYFHFPETMLMVYRGWRNDHLWYWPVCILIGYRNCLNPRTQIFLQVVKFVPVGAVPVAVKPRKFEIRVYRSEYVIFRLLISLPLSRTHNQVINCYSFSSIFIFNPNHTRGFYNSTFPLSNRLVSIKCGYIVSINQ